MVDCSVCFEKVSVNYVVIDRNMGLYCCRYCNESVKFHSIIKKTDLSYKDKHKLIEYKKKIDDMNKNIFHLINKLDAKIALL
tara:strand:- start:191 stop:436 length:246 start_codon:yes stop_codon:yes gene_type:complete